MIARSFVDGYKAKTPAKLKVSRNFGGGGGNQWGRARRRHGALSRSSPGLL